jgi:succinate dehydrogenase / fumarate reductase cytochrome b subunit
MNSTSTAPARARPKYYDVNLLHLPVAGLMSIFHRASGAAMFLLLIPLGLYALQESLGSEAGFARWAAIAGHPLAKLVVLGFVWSFVHHFFAGIRYLFLDVHVGISKEASSRTALAVMIAGIAGTLVVGWLIW